MNQLLKTVLGAAAVTISIHASAQVTLYEREGFEGQVFTTQKAVKNFQRFGFNDRASSAIVQGTRWEACDDIQFRGRCVVLRPGRYPSLSAMGLNNRVSSIRAIGMKTRIDDQRYAPEPIAIYDARRKNNERLYQANVTAVRAVVGAPEQRCWIEREQVAAPQIKSNVPGAIAGALIGGILGHQVGGGTGKDLATVGGAIAGGAVGATVGRNNSSDQPSSRNVQRCATTPNQTKPSFWDVTYEFRGIEHHIQMTAPPGATVTVNRKGEPRT
jgi:uncharacterized protein YcfJ